MGRSIASLLGFLGGILVIVSGVVAFVLRLVAAGRTSGVDELVLAALGAIVAVVLGLVILFFARPRLLWWRSRLLVNGIILVVLGVVAWVALPFGLLLLLGVILTVVAGLLFTVESVLPGRFRLRALFT